MLPKQARYQLRYTPIKYSIKMICSCPLRFLLQLRLCHRKNDWLANRQVAATPFSSLAPPQAALGNVLSGATPRRFYCYSIADDA